MNVATLAYPPPLTSRFCSLDRWAIPLTRLNKVLTSVSYFMVSYFGHSLYNVLSLEWEKMWFCLTVVTVALERAISIILRKINFIISTKIQGDYLLKRNWILYWFLIFDVFTTNTLKITAFTFGMPVEPSIFRTRQHEEDWRKCHEILFWRVLLNFVDTFLFCLRLYKNNGHCTYWLKVFLPASSV
jgi:hypothetical protein